jgi:3-oxoacyl-[acyl-carrier protein] reductase
MILVSGGRGLGRAIALDLACDRDVVTFSRGESDLRGHLPGIDITRPASRARLRPLLARADGLVNNAAIGSDGLLATMGEGDIERVIAANLTATALLTRLYLRARLARRLGGSVVTITSIAAHRGYAGLSVYGATKAALEAMTRSLAREMGPTFRFNAVAPGYFDSELSAGLTERQRDQIVRRTPMGRLATPEDIAPVVRLLLDSSFVTGQVLVVDGGLTA